jgi:hypothetical protein
MSGGKRIDDHKFFAGGPSKESPMPMKSMMKQEHSASDAGHEAYYEDTTEAIKSCQDKGASKAKSQKMKDGYRY